MYLHAYVYIYIYICTSLCRWNAGDHLAALSPSGIAILVSRFSWDAPIPLVTLKVHTLTQSIAYGQETFESKPHLKEYIVGQNTPKPMYRRRGL